MKKQLTSPFIVVAAATTVILVLLVWATAQTVYDWNERRLQESRLDDTIRTYNSEQRRYAELAETIEKAVKELHHSLLQYVFEDKREYSERFEKQSQALSEWLTSQVRTLQPGKLVEYREYVTLSMEPASFVKKVQDAFDRYRDEVRHFFELLPHLTAPAARLKGLQPAEAAAHQLFLLAGQARAYSNAVELIPRTKVFSPWPTLLKIAGLVLLIAANFWFTVRFYRRELSEMQTKVNASELNLEHQTKLAHKGQVAAELAHEIRNPLTAITLRLSSLQNSLSETADEYEDATLIRREIRRLNSISEDFLNLDRSPEPQLVSLLSTTVLTEARDLLAAELARREIELTMEPHEAVPLRADPEQLQQVLINLIKNSADSIPEKGTVTLRARRETLPVHGKMGDAVVFEVQDTGHGIPPEVQDRLFDPFFTTKADGSGLGLSVSERIVQKHGGVLDFKTELERGTTFRIVLPVSQRHS